jgi:hypothetical protein
MKRKRKTTILRIRKNQTVVRTHQTDPEVEPQPRDQDLINRADPDRLRRKNPEEVIVGVLARTMTKKLESLVSLLTSHIKATLCIA